MAWHKLADRLHMSLQRCKAETTSREFVRWLVYLDEATNHFKPEHYYWAQIAREVALVLATKDERAKISLEQFILKFTANQDADGESEVEPEQPSRAKIEAAVERSKSTWAAIFAASTGGRVQMPEVNNNGRSP